MNQEPREPNAPEIYALKQEGGSWRLSRRDFLAAGAAAAAASATGCATTGIGAKPAAGRAHAQSVIQLRVSHDGALLFSLDDGGVTKAWSLPQGGLIQKLEGLPGKTAILAATAKPPRLWRSANGQKVASWTIPELKADETAAGSREVTPKGTPLLCMAGPVMIEMLQKNPIAWDRASGEKRVEFQTEDNLKALVSDDAGRMLLGITTPGTKAHLWSTGASNVLQTYPSTPTIVSAVFSRDGRLVILGLASGKIKLLTIPELADVLTLQAHGSGVNGLTLTPDGQTLISCGDKHIKLWSLPNGDPLKTFEGHEGSVMSLATTPDGTLLASGDNGGRIHLWSLSDGLMRTNLMDLDASLKSSRGLQYKGVNTRGQTVTYTLPCGSPIPPGAVCTCNCVPGTMAAPCSCVSHVSRGSGSRCTCVPVHYWYPS